MATQSKKLEKEYSAFFQELNIKKRNLKNK